MFFLWRWRIPTTTPNRQIRRLGEGIWTLFWPEGAGIWTIQSSKVQMPGLGPGGGGGGVMLNFRVDRRIITTFVNVSAQKTLSTRSSADKAVWQFPESLRDRTRIDFAPSDHVTSLLSQKYRGTQRRAPLSSLYSGLLLYLQKTSSTWVGKISYVHLNRTMMWSFQLNAMA